VGALRLPRTAGLSKNVRAHKVRTLLPRSVPKGSGGLTDSKAVSDFVAAGCRKRAFGPHRYLRLPIPGGPPANLLKNTPPEALALRCRPASEEHTIYLQRKFLAGMQKNNWDRLSTITSSAVKQPVEGLCLSLIRSALRSPVWRATLAMRRRRWQQKRDTVCPATRAPRALDGLASSISGARRLQSRKVFADWEREIPAGRIGGGGGGHAAEICRGRSAFLSSHAPHVNGILPLPLMVSR